MPTVLGLGVRQRVDGGLAFLGRQGEVVVYRDDVPLAALTKDQPE
jgi:hypothetical protein